MNIRLTDWASRWASGKIARGTLAATLWQLVRVGSQALWTIALARSLGPYGYGGLAGVAGLATAIGSLSGVGFGLLMLQDASRDPSSFSTAWKHAVWAIFLSGSVFLVAFAFLAPLLVSLSGPGWQFAAIGLPELICFPLTITASYAFQTRERMGFAGAMYALVPASNLLAATLYFAFGQTRSLEGYLPWHAGSSVIAALTGYVLVTSLLRPGKARLSMTRRDAGEALGFSLMRVVDNGLGSLDKTLVLRLAGAEAAGIYTAAFRLVAVLALPVTSMAMAALPRLFRLGELAEPEGQAFIRRLTLFALGGGVLALLGVFVLSLALPLLLGQSFASSAAFARWLCLFPLFFGLSSLGCNVLVASRLRRSRIAAQVAGLVTLTLAMAVSIPAYGLAGAAGSLLAAHGVIVLTVWWVVHRGRRHATG